MLLKKVMIIEIPCNAQGHVTPEVTVSVAKITGIVTQEFLALGITPVTISFKTEARDA